MSGGALVILFLVWGLPILIGHHLGISRNRTGWLWGLLLGWLGVFILALMRPRTAADRLADFEAEKQFVEMQQQRLLAEVIRRPAKGSRPTWWH